MLIQREVIEAIRERIDIVEVVSQVVTLRRKGGSLMGLCPFHQEKSPSFSVIPAKGIYHCFGCGEGGDIFAFVQKTRGLQFMDAVRELADQCGVEIRERELSPAEKQRIQAQRGLHEICQIACEHFHRVLLTQAEGKAAMDYLRGRGVTADSIASFKLGYAPDSWDGLLNALHKEGVSVEQAVAAGLARWRDPDNPRRGAYDLFRARVIIPILDGRGRPIAFGGRLMAGSGGATADAPKYVNSPETDIYRKSKVLYGLSQARSAVQRRDRVLVVEGYFDVIALHQAGFSETVATCGTALTPEHLQIIRPLTRTVIALFDADEAGQRAAERSLDLFLGAGIEPLRLVVEGAKDPDEYLQAHDAAAFEGMLARSEPLFDMVMRRIVARCGPTPGGRQRAVEQLAPLVRRFPAASRSIVVARVAGVLGVNEQAVYERIGRDRGDRAAVVPPPTRWSPSPQLRALLHGLLHFHDEVAPVLLEFPSPQWLTENQEALRAIGLLLQGNTLPVVLAEVSEPDVGQVLREEAARRTAFTPEQAGRNARKYLIGLEMKHVQKELMEATAQADALLRAGDAAYLSALRKRGELQKRREELLRLSKAFRPEEVQGFSAGEDDGSDSGAA